MSIDTKTIRDLHAKRGDHPWGSSFEHAAYQHMPELLDAYDRLAELEAELARLRTDRDGAAEACRMLQEDKARLEQDNARLQDALLEIKALVDTGRWYSAIAGSVAEKALAGERGDA